MGENILLQSPKYIQINLKYIHFPLRLTCVVHFFCKSEKLYLSCSNDVNDRYTCKRTDHLKAIISLQIMVEKCLLVKVLNMTKEVYS